MADLLVHDAERLVTMTGDEIVGGWVAVTDGLVAAVGDAGSEPPAAQAVSARGCLVTPGLINTHHHIFQNLTRAFAPAVNATLFDWLSTLYPLWSRLDEEAAYVSAWIGLAERHDVRIHTHLAEDPDEDRFCLARFGRSPIEHVEEVGWAGAHVCAAP